MESMSSAKWVTLLGMLAVAGYQNRDKISEMLGRNAAPAGAPGQGTRAGPGNAGGAGGGGILSGGLHDLIDRFRRNGQAEVADSWVKTGPNQPLRPDQLEKAIGADALSTLSQQTGLSREELIARLSRDLPAAVDKFTPDGRLPTEAEAARLI
jgi:uncharacterized protein YidB (DUF937 family)